MLIAYRFRGSIHNCTFPIYIIAAEAQPHLVRPAYDVTEAVLTPDDN